MKKVILLAYLVFTVPSINAEEETLCEKQWNEYYENLPESERTSNDSLVRAVMIDDCNNDYKLAKERQKEMMVTSMHAYAEGNYVIAYNEFKILADVGYRNAQFSLAMLYYNGEGVIQDYKEAMKWFRLSAEQGHTKAQHNLGWMYYIGDGVIQDYKEAMKWFRLSAEQCTEGTVRSQYNLGWMYEQGEGVTKDYKEAMKWYHIAAEQGDVSSQSKLGYAYGVGQGVTQDQVIGYMYSYIAAANGDEVAKNNRDFAVTIMTSEQLIKANSLARECIKNNYKDCGYR